MVDGLYLLQIKVINYLTDLSVKVSGVQQFVIFNILSLEEFTKRIFPAHSFLKI